MSKDSHLFEWSLLILSWWFCCPLIANTFSFRQTPIIIQINFHRRNLTIYGTAETSCNSVGFYKENSRKQRSIQMKNSLILTYGNGEAHSTTAMVIKGCLWRDISCELIAILLFSKLLYSCYDTMKWFAIKSSHIAL